MGGPRTPQPPVYGTLGTPASGNMPGSRDLASQWTDNEGNLWLFGGQGQDTNPIYGLLNDLWRYNPATNQWTWMNGSTTSAGATAVFGTLGTSAQGNQPGGRNAAVSWTDNSGNFWLFGGGGLDAGGESDYLNDLWEYTPSTNQWAWIGGANASNQRGVYGTAGKSATANTPGARSNAVSWTDPHGNFWLFGGFGLDSAGNGGPLDDLWEFSPATREWTWMGGDSTLPGLCNGCGAAAVYGQIGTPAAANTPGGRSSASGWVDLQGNFWLFGGSGYSASLVPGTFNDLWRFNPSTHQWTWMSGSDTVAGYCGAPNPCNLPGIYGTLQTAAPGNTPGARRVAATWTDRGGNLWLFGGNGVDSAGKPGYLNDLWKFNTATGQWAWMSGANTVTCPGSFCGEPGFYGSLQTPALGNNPGGRNDATAWTDNKGNFWLFGGTGVSLVERWGPFQDLWEFQPVTGSQSVTETPTFSPEPGSDSTVQDVVISDTTPGASIDYLIDGNPPASVYTAPIHISRSQTITAIAGAPGYANSAVTSATYTVSSSPAAAPVFTPVSGTYNTAQTVTITDTSPGALIYYTTDGSAPGPASAVYQGPITVSSSQTMQAVAEASGVPNSAVASAVYTIGSASTLGEWAWMGGSNQQQQSGAYGNYGVPGAANIPGARQASTSWTDASGNLWLFGGAGFDGRGYNGFLNDLWEFNPSTRQWIWKSGSNLLPCNSGIVTFTCGGPSGVYGTLGSAAATNVPGGRFGVAGWADSQGRLWLFGGEGVDAKGLSGELNDLWRFDPSTNEWTWMGGSNRGTLSFYGSIGQPGVYGTLGVPAASNIPGSRYNAATWVDSHGNFWLFGGTGQDVGGLSSLMNDLWMFNPTTLQWEWVGGSNLGEVLVGYTSGAYGTLGVPAAGNFPGSRASAATWTDNDGKLWLFGGHGGGANGYFNDLWMYDPSSNEWAWISGASLAACPNAVGPDAACPLHPASYGSLGIPSAGNTPGGGPVSASWTDKQGNFWLLGGNDPLLNGNNGGSDYGTSNELWAFKPSTGQWAWMGAAYVGNCSWVIPVYAYPFCTGTLYGNLGVAAPGNIPAARTGAASWTDTNGNFWLFGGGVGNYATPYSIGNVNDLWEYQPSLSTLPPAASAIFSFAQQANQPSGQVSLTNGMANAAIYYTTDGSTPTTASTPYTGPITVSTTETVTAIAAAPGYRNSVATSTAYTVDPAPPAPTFSVAPGTYTSIQTVTIADTQANTTIYYTTDGSTPVATSPVYSGPITVPASETISALAVAYAFGYAPPGGFPDHALFSPVATAAYTIHLPPAAAPVLSVPPGTYTSQPTLTITDATPGATIHYTTNGTTPTTNSQIYYGPIGINISETIEAMAVATGYTNSPVASAAYVIIPQVTTPLFYPPAGTYLSPLSISVAEATTGATVYYTTDGTTPTTSSNVYEGQITLTNSATVQAIAVLKGYTNSVVATGHYTLIPFAASPVFSPPSGTYAGSQTVTLSDASAGVTIYYTTDGSRPTTNGKVYNGPILVAASETINAVAEGGGFANSAVSTATYTIGTPLVAGPTFSPPAGTYSSPQTVTMADTTAGATIYYTTDGSTPSLTSAVYKAPLVVSSPETIAAIAAASGYITSAPTAAAYVINQPANPALVLDGLTPAFTGEGGPGFTLTVNGTGFLSGATIYWGSTALSTQFIAPTQLTAQVPAGAIAAPGTNTVTIQEPGQAASNGLQFEVDSAPAGSMTSPVFSNASATIKPGASATYGVKLPAPVTNASAACLNLPPGASCSYSATTGAITVSTTATTPVGGYQVTVVFIETEPGAAGAVVLIPLLLLPLLLTGKRSTSPRAVTFLLGLTLLAATACISACGGGGASGATPAKTPTPTYQVTSSGVVSLTIQ
jgi:N-acetylneuraminic acid mutarotase